jgi:hypothetical protein
MPLSTPVAVTSCASLSGVVTVTCSAAHGLVQNQGFSLQNTTNPTFNLNGTVASVTSSTVFTFNLAVPDATTSTGGTVNPAKEIIILGVNPFQANNTITVRYLLWLTTVTPFPATATSQWSGASTAENTAIVLGTTVELARSISLSSTVTKAQLEAAISQDFTAQQAAFAAAPAPGAFYGVIYDGTGWSS